jgi:dual specificity phosphatase 12
MARVPPFFPVSATVQELDAISEVLPKQLYLTNYRGAARVQELRALGVTHIAAVGTEFEDDGDAMPGVSYWKKSIEDVEDAGEQMALSLRDGAAFIHRAIDRGGCVLVHCAAGLSRSTTVVLAYMMLHRRQTLRGAFAEVVRCRRPVWPNDGFFAALIALETEVHGQPTIAMEEYLEWGDYEGPPEDGQPDGSPEDAQRALDRVPLPRLERKETFVDREDLKDAREGAAAELATLSLTRQHTMSPDERRRRAIKATEQARSFRASSNSSINSSTGASEQLVLPPFLPDLLDALVSEQFEAVLNRFVERECHQFLRAGEGYTLEQTEVHAQYQRIFESRIEAHLRKSSTGLDELLAALVAADGVDGTQSLLESLRAVEDFEAFATMMAQRALEREEPS